MKRIASLLFAFVLLLSIAGCGGETESNEGSVANEALKAVEATAPEESTVANDSTANIDTEPPASAQEEPGKDDDKVESEIIFTEMVAVDNDKCSIKVTGIDPDNMWGYTVNVLVENKSPDTTYMFSVESAAVNGVQSDPFFASEVAPGKKSNEEISFSGDELEESGIVDFTDIELTMRVYDSDDWTADEVAAETFHIYPYGEDKAVEFVRDAQPSDNVLIDDDYVTVIVTGYEEDDIWGYTANLFLLNKTDKTVMFSVDDASVNGFMVDPFYATSVSPGKAAFSSMSWSDTALEENSITEVEVIEFTLRAYDEENWLDDDLVEETITLNP